MGALSNKQDAKTEVVTAREFDITKYTKVLGSSIAVVAAATAAAIKTFGNAPTAVVVAALAVTAVAVAGISLVMAADMIARALATGRTAAANPDGSTDNETSAPAQPGEEVRIKKTESRVSRV